MSATRFIAGKIRVRERTVMISIAVSFLVMIIAVCVSQGFRNEIRDQLSAISGDVQLTNVEGNILDEKHPIHSKPSYLGQIDSLDGVLSIERAVYRAGIIKAGDMIQGVVFKGIENDDSLSSLGARIPSRLSSLLGLTEGDKLRTYFVGDKLSARVFTVKDIYPSILETSDNMVVYVSLADMQKLNGWKDDEVSALEIRLKDAYRDGFALESTANHIGTISLTQMTEDDDTLISASIAERYRQIFQWLDLVDYNVFIILILMTIVAGVNMISGLLIVLFRNTTTIGTLKSMGMTDKSIAGVFLISASKLTAKGLAGGNIAALAFCLLQSEFHIIKLNPSDYFVPYVPIHISWNTIIAADLLSFAAIMILLLIPSLYISRIDPAKTMRAE